MRISRLIGNVQRYCITHPWSYRTTGHRQPRVNQYWEIDPSQVNVYDVPVELAQQEGSSPNDYRKVETPATTDENGYLYIIPDPADGYDVPVTQSEGEDMRPEDYRKVEKPAPTDENGYLDILPDPADGYEVPVTQSEGEGMSPEDSRKVETPALTDNNGDLYILPDPADGYEVPVTQSEGQGMKPEVLERTADQFCVKWSITRPAFTLIACKNIVKRLSLHGTIETHGFRLHLTADAEFCFLQSLVSATVDLFLIIILGVSKSTGHRQSRVNQYGEIDSSQVNVYDELVQQEGSSPNGGLVMYIMVLGGDLVSLFVPKSLYKYDVEQNTSYKDCDGKSQMFNITVYQ
ncbi:hypothetical protein PoB_007315100 [Plakobranchus ocellatus]|uniref:Uncharacterized protein n=1 Tax=Plakobranchus ocellatus TaxID=259542 RepID=A0AAV4DRX6_9GAST|nr:hypothetical protein PoB_007315100 [Plakobranchus ocellatus]